MSLMELIKELRERTNAGMVDCKKALESSDMDVEKAIIWLKSNGKIKAAKKAGRISTEGLVTIAGNDKKAVLVEVNCETDFVAKNEKFKKFVDEVAQTILKSKAKNVEEALESKNKNNETIKDAAEEATARIGEKIALRRFEIVEAKKDEVLGSFVHINGQIAAIVKVQGSNVEAARNVAMHAAAMKPEYIFVKDVPAERLQIFKEEFVKPANFEKKPVQIQEKIIEGSLNKKLAEVVLEKQPFMMEDSLTIDQYLISKKNKLIEAVRYTVGEGIEKKESDFAAEVAEQMSQK